MKPTVAVWPLVRAPKPRLNQRNRKKRGGCGLRRRIAHRAGVRVSALMALSAVERGQDQRELLVHLAGDAGQEGGRHEHRHQGQGDAGDRPAQLLHRLDRGLLRPDVLLLHDPPDVLDHDDGVVDHDGDGEHQAEQRDQVDGQAERGHQREGADQRDRDGDGRDQRAAPVLQEDEDGEEDQDAGFDQGLDDAVDGVVDEDRGVEQDRVVEPLGERALELVHLGLDRLLHRERVGGRQLVDRDARGGLPGQVGEVAVGLGTQLDPGHVADADQLAAAVGRRLDDDVLELGDLVEPAEHVDRVLEGLVGRLRRDADLAGGHLRVLLVERLDHVVGHQPEGLQLLRVEPDPHAVGAGAEHVDLRHAGHAGELVLQVDRGVVGQEQAVIDARRRDQVGEQQDVGRLLLDRDALRRDLRRQLGQRDRDPLVDQGLRGIHVGADLEGHDQRVGAVRRAVGLHVEHARHAVDLLLDRDADRVGDDGGTGTRIAGGDVDRGRRDVGYCAIGRRRSDTSTQEHGDDRDHAGEDRPVDEELGEHGRLACLGRGLGRPARRRLARRDLAAGHRALRAR